jgi:hypothetical protein
MAIILLGPSAMGFLPNGAAKADAHDRHGVDNGELVEHASHCLGNGEFAYGASAEYKRAIGGGSGLSVQQDRDMVYGMLVDTIDQVQLMRDQFIAEQRRVNGSHRWYTRTNLPAEEYDAVLALVT